MGDASREELQILGEIAVTPQAGPVVSKGLVVPVRVLLDGASLPAQHAFARAVQRYADRLAQESGNQEASNRAPGAATVEIIETSVIRAQEALDKRIALEKSRTHPLDGFALAGAPIFSGAAGVLGSYLHGPILWIAFVVTALLACASVIRLAWKGMQ